MHPIAKAAFTPRFLRRVRTALGHTRWALDRIGFPAGTIIHWQEWFTGTGTYSGITSMVPFTQAALQGWVVNIDSNHSVTVAMDGIKNDVALRAGNTSINSAAILLGGVPSLTANVDWAAEASFTLEDAASANTLHMFGYIQDFIGVLSPINPGIRFKKIPGTANWLASARDASGETVVDTGVPATDLLQWKTFRIEWRGANTNDGGVPTTYFFIDGAHVASITANIPGAAASARHLFLGVVNQTGGSAAAERMFVWSVNFATNWQ